MTVGADKVSSQARSAAAPGRAALAVAAAWAVPGLGHVLVGRARRGLFFGAVVFGCFTLGLLHDGRLALRNPEHPFLSTLQVVANVGVGPADLIARWAVYDGPAYGLPPNPSYPSYERRVQTLQARLRSQVSPYGTAYLWTAGLMNLMLLFDVFDLATGRKGRRS